MSSADTLRVRQAVRDDFLARMVGMIEGDERVVAAWLYGSLGRGDGDALSDIDLWVVVADDHLESVRAETREIIARAGKPLLVVDAPQNAPPGGAFLSVVYESPEGGPQHVDWTWQAASGARLPHDARLLFDKGAIRSDDKPLDPTLEERANKAAKQTGFFWMMVPVVAKSIARRQPWVTLNLLTLMRYTLDEIRWLMGDGAQKPHYPTRSSTQPPSQAREQIALLREMAAELEELTGELREIGEAVTAESLQWIYGSIALAEAVIENNLDVRAV